MSNVSRALSKIFFRATVKMEAKDSETPRPMSLKFYNLRLTLQPLLSDSEVGRVGGH